MSSAWAGPGKKKQHLRLRPLHQIPLLLRLLARNLDEAADEVVDLVLPKVVLHVDLVRAVRAHAHALVDFLDGVFVLPAMRRQFN